MTLIDHDGQTNSYLTPTLISTIVDRLIQNPPEAWNDEKKQQVLSAVTARYQKYHVAVPMQVKATLHMNELLGPSNPLVKLVQRVGPKCTSTLDACKEMLASVETRDISYTQVACVLLYMVISHEQQPYNPSIFVEALREHRSGKRLDWQDVVHAFDREGLNVTKSQFLGIYQALLPLAQEYENFDIQMLWGGAWTHGDTQLSFVVGFLSCTSDELDATKIPRLRKAFSLEDFEDASEEVKAYAAKAITHPLVSFEATSVIFGLIFRSQDTYNHAQTLDIPNTVINANTSIFIVAASAVPKNWGGLQEQAMKQLFFPYLQKNLPNYNFVLHGLWKKDNHWLAGRLIDAYARSPMILPLIFEHAQEHGWIEPLVSMSNELSLDLAAFAHARNALDYDAWVQTTLQALPDILPKALYSYLQTKANHELENQRSHNPPEIPPLTVKTVHSILTILQDRCPDEELLKLQRACLQSYPRLINYGEGFDEVIDANGAESNAIPPEADTIMQEHFKKLYSSETDVRELIEILRKYKTSNDSADQDIFACMISGLFDEYNCFGEYPLEALATTAVLF
ncbi:hypothetical protein LTS18_007891, partial [Coniosporium uncinatum]